MRHKVSHIANLAAWVLGTAGAMSAYWYVVVYLFDQFDRGYGRDTWFLLNLYLSALSVVIGLFGYALVGFIGPRPRTLAFAALAGIAYAAGELLLVFALAHAFPDRDMMAQGFVGAFVLGALSSVAAGRLTWSR